jgi:nicotinate-nucleotide adenylyltransferase
LRRIGVFGGTFDPIHTGHLAAAQAAMEILGLDKVVFVPAACPPHKRGQALADARHRLAMVRLAARDNPHFEVSSAEIDAAGPSFTVDTLEVLKARCGPCRLHLLMGLDQALQLDTWRRPERILTLAEVDVLSRPGFDPAAIPLKWRRLVRTVEVPGLEISSSLVRNLAGRGLSISYLVPSAVARYIHRHGLYRKRGKQDRTPHGLGG